MYIGAHISIAKGFAKAVKMADGINANTMQFFTRNPRGAKAKVLDNSDVQEFINLTASLKFGPVVAHAPYTMNLATPKIDAREFAIATISDDLARLDKLKVPYLCIHPGSHTGAGTQEGIKNISSAIDEIFTNLKTDVMLLLETMAGTGTEIGGTFEELSEIIMNTKSHEKIGICFDTCHVFASGYDIKNHLEEVLKQFDIIIGLSKIKAFHLNDSLKPLGSKRDRHAPIGDGLLGKTFFKELLNIDNFKHIPFLLETPGGMEGYKKEILMLRGECEDSIKNR